MAMKDRGRTLAAGLLAGLLVGGGFAMVTPAGAAVKEAAGVINWKSIWKTEIKPRADKRYYTKKLSNARYYTKADATSFFESKTAHDASLLNYYTEAQSDAAYYSKAQIDAKLALFVNSVTASAGGDQSLDVTVADLVVRSVSLMPPANGTVLVSSAAYLINTGAGSSTSRCSLTTAAVNDFDFLQYAVITDPGDTEQISGTRAFPVTKGNLLTVNFVCSQFAGSSDVRDSALTAIFAPA